MSKSPSRPSRWSQGRSVAVVLKCLWLIWAENHRRTVVLAITWLNLSDISWPIQTAMF